jgi:hypothetical protein
MRTLVLLFGLSLLTGCFWGDADGNMFLRVSSSNYTQYEGLLYPQERADAWRVMFENRARLCADGTSNCADDDREPSGRIEFFLPYDTSRGRGLITQKGDLQITTHLRVGAAYKALADDGYGDWSYFTDGGRIEGTEGDGCGVAPEGEPEYVRTGIGRCLREEVEANIGSYRGLNEDLRIVLLVNLLGEDDVRSVECQDALDRDPWDMPRTLEVNYNAEGPVVWQGDEDRLVYVQDDDEVPLPQCDVEVFTQMQLGFERYSGDFYGQDATDPGDFIVDEPNGDDETRLGTVELESLTLPDDGGSARAVGRFNLRYTSERFAARDGKVLFEGSFDVAVRKDVQAVDEPERETDLEQPDN